MPSLEHATVGDAMHPGVVTCGRDALIGDVARAMATHHVHCIVVLGPDYEHSGESAVWGIISDLDLVRNGILRGAEEAAGALAQQPIISVKPTMPLREAGELMVSHGVTHLVVIEPATRRPVGILSTLDIADILAWGPG
jgi:CBS domain-containing protein